MHESSFVSTVFLLTDGVGSPDTIANRRPVAVQASRASRPTPNRFCQGKPYSLPGRRRTLCVNTRQKICGMVIAGLTERGKNMLHVAGEVGARSQAMVKRRIKSNFVRKDQMGEWVDRITSERDASGVYHISVTSYGEPREAATGLFTQDDVKEIRGIFWKSVKTSIRSSYQKPNQIISGQDRIALERDAKGISHVTITSFNDKRDTATAIFTEDDVRKIRAMFWRALRD